MYGERKALATARRHTLVQRCCELLIRDRVNEMQRTGACTHRSIVRLRLVEFAHWQASEAIYNELRAVRRLIRE